MIKEIGGEFYKTPKLNINKDGIFDLLKGYNYQLFESGREGFEIINQISNKKILFPSYACNSMFQFLKKENLVFYNVDSDFNIDIKDIENKLTEDIEILIFINYFGKLQDKKILSYLSSLKMKGIVIIEDTTHSFFTNICTVGDYCIASLRKWFCIPNGGILYSKREFLKLEVTKNIIFSAKREKAFLLKENYSLRGNISKKIFLDLFNETEEILDKNKKINDISNISFKVLKEVDIKNLIKKRKENYKYLSKKLKSISKIKICKVNTKKEVPLFLVIRLDKKERNSFRKYLTKNRIYCPIHWPLINELNEKFEVKNFIENIISIPIDQRYSNKDMKYIYKKILKYFKEKY